VGKNPVVQFVGLRVQVKLLTRGLHGVPLGGEESFRLEVPLRL